MEDIFSFDVSLCGMILDVLLGPGRKRHLESDKNDQFEPEENRQQPRLVI